MLWSNDSDGVPLSNAEHGLPPLFKAKGYEVVDAGFHQPLSDDFSAQIAVLKAAGVDIVTRVFLPPDFTDILEPMRPAGLPAQSCHGGQGVVVSNCD